ncbi:MAG: hypothetical protein IIA66_14795 [Planctomycetes bacterium]|nr:hypothetical protein [Planctomycetota bacterium]
MQFPAIPASVLVDAAACALIGTAGTAFGLECPLEITDPANHPKKTGKNPKIADQFAPFLRLDL